MLVAIATNAILASDRFPQATDTWEEKTDKNKTWYEWKDTYLAANESLENSLCAAGDTGKKIGMANAAATPTNDPQEPHNIPQDTL